ncbi:MAG: glycoside hydrolase family 3 protein [Bacteroidota bacterium]
MSNETPKRRVSALLSQMSLSQKVGQMIQADWTQISPEEVTAYEIGSLLNSGESSPTPNTKAAWQQLLDAYQNAAQKTTLQIPLIFGIDAVHGHNNVFGTTIFPHNIGLGAANDEAGLFEMGKIVAEEVLSTGINWNFSPCLALAEDPRWGRTYESFSTDSEIVNKLALAFTKGQHAVGMVTCAKHYLGDGNTQIGTGLANLVDRGNAILSDLYVKEKLLPPYRSQIEEGVQTIMPSYSSLNGVKMHQNTPYIKGVLKQKLQFQGFVVTDWQAVREIPNANFEEQIWIAVSAGIDMLMEPILWKATILALKRGVENGHIPIARIDDAVRRILQVKWDSGLFDTPTFKPKRDELPPFRSESAKKVAVQLAEKSLVLLKNEDQVLPIKSGKKVLVLGEGADNVGLQCGGWTIDWNGYIDQGEKTTNGITILEGLCKLAAEKNVEIWTDTQLIDQADMVIQVLSEMPYAEMSGDSSDISLTGPKAFFENKKIMALTDATKTPVVTLLLAGRHLTHLAQPLKNWSAFIMAYLPGSEGGTAIANLLFGETNFTGKLPMPWYQTEADIKKDDAQLLFDVGFSLRY